MAKKPTKSKQRLETENEILRGQLAMANATIADIWETSQLQAARLSSAVNMLLATTKDPWISSSLAIVAKDADSMHHLLSCFAKINEATNDTVEVNDKIDLD